MKVFANYKGINARTPEGRMQIFGAISAFMQQPAVVHKKLREMGMTQFTATDDFPTEIRQLIEKYNLGQNEIDTGYLTFFDVRDFAGTPAPGFRVREVSSGLTFSKRPEGGKATIYRVTGTEAFVGFDTYGGGLEFDQAWFQDQQWWLIEDTAAEFRSKWYKDKASTMYGLIGAISANQNVAWVAGTTELERDIATLNAAAAAMLTALYNAGYAVGPQTPVAVLCPLLLKGRLMRALAAQYVNAGVSGSHLKVEYNITPVFSMGVQNAGQVVTNVMYMAVPGLKNKLGEKMPLTTYTDFNIETFATAAVGWGRYGAYLNEAQWRRLATA
jgi:hypothetical protein